MNNNIAVKVADYEKVMRFPVRDKATKMIIMRNGKPLLGRTKPQRRREVTFSSPKWGSDTLVFRFTEKSSRLHVTGKHTKDYISDEKAINEMGRLLDSFSRAKAAVAWMKAVPKRVVAE